MTAQRRPAPRYSGAAQNSRQGARRQPRRRPGAMGWLRGQLARRPLPVWVLVVADALVFAVALNVFALFHHVLPRHEQAVGVQSQRSAGVEVPVAEVPAQGADSAEEIQSAGLNAPGDDEAPADPEGVFASKFAGKFTDGGVESDGSSYRSANVNLTLTDQRVNNVDYHVIDIYVRDIACFKTGFARDTFGRGMYERVSGVMERIGAIAGINGDFYGGRADGIVARNGTLYRDDENPKRDICVLYWDGRMETRGPEGFDAEAEMANGAYQIWNFGPMLLDESGQAMEKFNSDVNPRNPRSAVGYYEPGHYCFVAVDGRSDVSKGATLKQLSMLMQSLGCARAYNLDGGDSSVMVFNGAAANVPSNGGRTCTDIIAIAEP